MEWGRVGEARGSVLYVVKGPRNGYVKVASQWP